MCGIVGFFGKNVLKNLMFSLKKLEYRGYDSAGVCVCKNNDFFCTKSVGEISNLEKKVNYNFNADFGIAHTRWATHGRVNEINCHPHFSENKKWCLVHNGIIENYRILKDKLQSNGIKFKSETDTEVVANMFEQSENDGISAIIKECSKLEGSFAFVCMQKNVNKLFCGKRTSPLFLGKNSNQILIASDVSVFDPSYEIFEFLDNEFAEINNQNVVFYDKKMQIICKKSIKVSLYLENTVNGEYSTFMEKEIAETPHVLKSIAQNYQTKNVFKSLDISLFENARCIWIVGCGTAYHAGLVGSLFLENVFFVPIRVCIASEFYSTKPNVSKSDICIFISQSGETADTLKSIEFAKSRNAFCLSILNVTWSSMSRVSDVVLPCFAGTEKSVASTKAFSAQISVFYLLSKFCLGKNALKIAIKNLLNLSLSCMLFDEKKLLKAISLLNESKEIFFTGRGIDFFLAKEGCLKLKEISYFNANAIASGEMKHGTLAVVSNDVTVVLIATKKELFDKVLSDAEEIKARGGKVIIISPFDCSNVCDIHVPVSNFIPNFVEVPCSIVLQRLAFLFATKKGFNPDKPRNLAKSVTV